MMIFEPVSVSRSETLYSAWPDVISVGGEHLLCIFTECRHHTDRRDSRIMLCESPDGGYRWENKRPFPGLQATDDGYCNCARLSNLPDGRICVSVDRIPWRGEGSGGDREAAVLLFFSNDGGKSWSEPVKTPLHGIVPGKLTVLDSGRWLLSAQYGYRGKLTQFLRCSDDEGKSWSRRITVAHSAKFDLCEGSLLPLGGGVVVALLREDSRLGLDCKKVISRDDGESWGPITDFPLPGCHRPVAGILNDGRVMITYRFAHGAGGFGKFTQNFFSAFTDRESLLRLNRKECACRIVPVDYDRSPVADTGYSGWVQLPDGKVFIVNYIVDDAVDKGQIRGYHFDPRAIML